jgi:hypothetical protein
MLPAKRPGAPLSPAKQSFALGFLTGKEIDWLPEAIRLLRDELPNIEINVSSLFSRPRGCSCQGQARRGV